MGPQIQIYLLTRYYLSPSPLNLGFGLRDCGQGLDNEGTFVLLFLQISRKLSY